MEVRHGATGRVWIADRGMANAEKLAWLRSTGRRYIIGAPKSELKKFAFALAASDGWRTVQEGVEVKLARRPETDETVIVCRSADRRAKEQAMHDKFSWRIEMALERLAVRIASSRKRLDPAKVKAAFRIQKDQLNLRPIWHQHEDRVQAHILVCFLAFVLWRSLEMWQQRAGLGNSPRTILEELARIQSQDVVLPTAAHGQIRLRCVTQPDAAPAALLARLGVVLPKRMRLAEHEAPQLAATA